jgi:hypothetical protein
MDQSRSWIVFVAAIFLQEAGCPAARTVRAALGAGALGRDGWYSQVSKNPASGVPDTRSAYVTKSLTFAFP